MSVACTEAVTVAPPGVVSAILELVLQRTGLDFSRYREQTVRRRIQSRMLAAGAASADAYCDRLRQCPDEAERLVDRLTIHVSRFYRNAPTFDALRRSVIPALAGHGEPLRIWSAGCASGEEAFTLAMLLDEAGCEGTVYATDVSRLALQAAEQGVYAPQAAAELPAALAERYLLRGIAAHREVLRVRPALRARVRFSLHDVLAAAPPAGAPFHLICCRNVLIYLCREAQVAAQTALREKLAAGGVLCLGEAEWPLPQIARTLAPLPGGARLFRAVDAEAVS